MRSPATTRPARAMRARSEACQEVYGAYLHGGLGYLYVSGSITIITHLQLLRPLCGISSAMYGSIDGLNGPVRLVAGTLALAFELTLASERP